MKLAFKSKYFDGELPNGFGALYTAKTIVAISTALLGIFLPIFLYNLFNKNFLYVAAYYGIGYFVFAFIVPFSTRFLNDFGFRRALRISIFMGALFYSILYFVNKENFIYLIPFSMIALLLFRILYWVPYHVDFTKFTDKINRGRELSVVIASGEFVGIFIPLLSGFIISRFNFDVLFLIAVILFLVSGIPYLFIPRTEEKFSWKYMESWKEFFSKNNRKIVLAFMADGAETLVVLLIWPIFIFTLLDGDYLEVGLISTFIIGASVFLQLLLGKYLDKSHKKEMVLHFGSVLYAIGWIIKIFVATSLHIFFVGTFHNFFKIFTRTSFDTLSYEIAADKGHYVDEFSVLHEMAINLGRVIMICLIVIMSFFVALQWAFVLAAISALFLNLLKSQNTELLTRV